ncbi:MAG: AbgT family transporter [Pseudomonadales bacterium]
MADARQQGWLDRIERVGNRLPDPAVLFLALLLLVWDASALLAQIEYGYIDPRSGAPIKVENLLRADSLAAFLGGMVATFVGFHPLGVVLVAMLGIGVADHTGFIRAGLRALLSATSPRLLTPMLLLVAIVSHTAADAGYVLVIPLGAVIFQAAGRHPLAGIAAAFAGVSGGFSANFVPSALDPMLQGISQAAGRLLDPELVLNPLNNWFFTASSTLIIVAVGWFVTDRIVEPRLRGTELDGDQADAPALAPLSDAERRGLRVALGGMMLGILLLVASAWSDSSAWRAPNGALADSSAPLMKSVVPLIFLLFLLPGVAFGYVSGSVRTHRDLVAGMTSAMSGMGYYIVMAFFAALFIAEFGRSNLGALLALTGAAALEAAALPLAVTVVAVTLITALVNLFIGSSSAKWALLAPVLVPMLMQLGLSPDLTQAAYRVGDSSTNIITPLMPYFPLVVVFCQRYVTRTGIGTVVAMMLPYSLTFLLVWTIFLLGYWALDLPLGLQASYGYAPP